MSLCAFGEILTYPNSTTKEMIRTTSFLFATCLLLVISCQQNQPAPVAKTTATPERELRHVVLFKLGQPFFHHTTLFFCE